MRQRNGWKFMIVDTDEGSEVATLSDGMAVVVSPSGRQICMESCDYPRWVGAWAWPIYEQLIEADEA